VLFTTGGIGLGATVDDLESAFGQSVRWSEDPDDITGAWHFVVETGIESEWRPREELVLYGRFDGDPALEGTVVSQIQGGFGFDEC
jgi:hypothetical protein